MKGYMRKVLVIWFPTMLLFLHDATGHSWLTNPPCYLSRTKPTRKCKGQDCTNACPRLRTSSSVTTASPAAVWRRGQRVQITWNRNNHHGGLFRLSIVPLAQWQIREMHTRFTLVHGCWETGLHKCATNEDCGTDKQSKAYGRKIVVPAVLPNGLYVFSYVWYGGLHFRRHKGFFPDFHSCSIVRVRGGLPLGGSYKPFFEAGTGKRIKNGVCQTSADFIGQCGNKGCPNGKAMATIPKVFRNGGIPAFTTEMVQKAMGVTPKSETDESERLCRGRVCCPKSCGACGGRKCARRPGGGKNCCQKSILASKKKCNKNPPPCIKN